jgi:signal transduction histidine kinase
MSVAVAYWRSLLSIKTLGVVCCEGASIAFLFLGYITEPHLSVVWVMGGLYISFFIQAKLIDNPKLKFLCYLKPLATNLTFGVVSGQLYLKEWNEGITMVSVVLFGVLATYSFIASEDIKQRLLGKLKEVKQQLTAIISAVPVGIFVLTTQDEPTMANEACLSLLGCTDAQQIRDKLGLVQFRQGSTRYLEADQSLAEDLRSYLASSSDELASFGETEHDERALNWQAKKTTWNSEPAIVVVIKDLTDVLRLERTQMESQFKNVMLRSVSHELRTPTNGILHFVQAVATCEDIPPWARLKLNVAELSCKHLLLLIGDLLDFSQLVAARFSLALRPFELRRVLEDCVELMRLVAERKKIKLVTHFDPMLPGQGYSDQHRLSQVLLNLLSNAVKFTPKKGRIEVVARLTDARQMEVLVTDNGIGIAPDNFARLFQSFGRLESSNSINPQGVGLGLHISNLLSLQLGRAPIEVKSVLGEGSCFSFKVDISAGEVVSFRFYDEECFNSEEGLSAQQVSSFKVSSKKNPPVLVVDDSPFNRMIVVELLAAHNIQSAEADNGRIAYDYIIRKAQVSRPVRVVVMDFEMPELNGPAACRMILARLNELGLPAPKIICHTAYTSDEDLRLCTEAGMVDILPKPSPCDVMLSTIVRHLG